MTLDSVWPQPAGRLRGGRRSDGTSSGERAALAADRRLAGAAKALGHPVRVRIVRLLAGRGGCACGEIVDRLPLAQATVSQHLRVLTDAGLLRARADGARVDYCLQGDALERLGAAIEALRPPAVACLPTPIPLEDL